MIAPMSHEDADRERIEQNARDYWKAREELIRARRPLTLSPIEDETEEGVRGGQGRPASSVSHSALVVGLAIAGALAVIAVAMWRAAP